MNRQITNTIRFFMDECLPPIIRDNYYFMYPFFYIWFKGKNVSDRMHFKSKVAYMSMAEYEDFYRNYDSLAKDRPTDLNEDSIKYMIANFYTKSKNLVDIGCGRGYFLNRIKEATKLETWGCDVYENTGETTFKYQKGNIENLPFPDKSFDIVTCCHTLEHVLDLKKAVSEIKRIARKQVIVVVPKQRYFYYTLDEHVRFFSYKEMLITAMDMKHYSCIEVWGDWVYIGEIIENE